MEEKLSTIYLKMDGTPCNIIGTEMAAAQSELSSLVS